MTDSAQDGSVCRHPVALPPIDKKASLHTCLKRRLKRFGVCNDEQRQQGVDREAKPEVYANLLHKRSQQEIRTLEEPRVSLESYLQTLPKLDPVHRTLVWVLCSDEGEEGEEVTEEHLHSLPIRGTIEPRKIVTPACSERGTEITSLSHCESDRGTNGRGTPPSRDENQQRLDYLCKRLQEKQQKALRMYLRHCGNLPYLPLSRNSKFPQLQPIEDAPEITPDIIPFLVTPLSSKNLDPEEPHCTNNVHSQPKSQYSVTCHWKSCNQRCRSQKELYIHIEEDHIADRDTMHEEQWVCLWQDCHANICHFSERYKLLSHVQAVHCRESRTLAHHRSVSELHEWAVCVEQLATV